MISFGQISFVAIGAFSAGVITIPTRPKHLVLPGLWSFIADHSVSNFVSFLIAAGLGAMFALIVRAAADAPVGDRRRHRHVRRPRDHHNVLQQWTKIGPGPTTLSLVPISVGDLAGAARAAVFAAIVAFLYQSRAGPAACCGRAVKTRRGASASAST